MRQHPGRAADAPTFRQIAAGGGVALAVGVLFAVLLLATDTLGLRTLAAAAGGTSLVILVVGATTTLVPVVLATLIGSIGGESG